MKRAWIAAVLALCLAVLPVTARAAASEELTPYIQKAIQYYHHYQEEAQAEIDDTVSKIRELDPKQGELWEKIMADWSWCNSQMPITMDVLPDGLPQDNSLCIVILGYSLKDDGSLEDELVQRLTVGLESARKYPNAYVAVTGGGTADDPKITEAGQMAAWLMENGIDESRIIVENKSLSTNENAVNTYRILRDSYETVTSVAVVSSDYHLGWGCAMFKTMMHYVTFNGGRTIDVVANAACATEKSTDNMFSQAWGVSVITHTPMDTENQNAPARYWVDEGPEETLEPIWITPPTEAVTEEPAEETPAFALKPWMGIPVVLLAGVLALQLKARKAKKRRRRENPVWKKREMEKQNQE